MKALGVRVLHLVNGLRAGGKERVAVELARAGRGAGHDDRIALFEHAPGGAGELDVGDVPVHDEVIGDGTLGRARRLARLVRRLRPAVVHAHNDSGLVLSSLVRRLRSAAEFRAITTLHNLPVAPARRHRWAVRALAGAQDVVTCVSEDLRAQRMGAGWIRDARVIPNGVDLGRFSPSGPAEDLRGQLGVAPGALLVGMVARLDVGKRPLDLVRAARECDAAVEVVLIGDGPARAEALAGGAAGARVHHVPFAADVASTLRGLDAVALVSDHEGLPMSLLEAMACGKPVVASAVGGVPELLGDEGADGLVPRGDARALAGALERLALDPAMRGMGRALRRRVEERYDLRAVAHEYDALYLARR